LRTKVRSEAETALQAALAGEVALRPAGKESTLHEAADAFLASRERSLRGLTPTTLAGYRTFVKKLKEIVPEYVPAAAIRPVDARHIVDQFQERFGLSDSGAKKRHNLLRMLFNWLVEEDMFSRNPVKLGDAPKAKAKQRPPISDAEYQALQESFAEAINASGASEEAIRSAQTLSDLAEVLWRSGMRSVQAYRLAWDGIDLEKMEWELRSPGENKGRVQLRPINRHLKPILQRRRLVGGAGPFQPAGRMTYLWRRWKQEHPEFEGWSWHQMRSRVVTRLAELGEGEAKKWLVGHKTEAVNNLYNPVSVENMRQAVDLL